MCDHPSCVSSSLLGLKHGIFYGAKIRFFHAFIMTMLFRKGSMKDKLIAIAKLTYEHAKNLGIFVFIYKSCVCLMVKARKKQSKVHNLLSGALCGYLVFGRKKTNVNQQIVLYLLSRILLGGITNLKRKGILKSNIQGFPILAAICWGMVMMLFEDDKECLQSSLTSSMQYLYKDSDQPLNHWTQLFK